MGWDWLILGGFGSGWAAGRGGGMGFARLGGVECGGVRVRGGTGAGEVRWGVVGYGDGVGWGGVRWAELGRRRA